jgi:hypothetical protein
MTYDPNKIREKLIKKEKESGKKNDPRFLNYFDLEMGKTMTIRLLPDGGDTGELWLDYATHGKALRNKDVGSISCVYVSDGEKCSVCGYSYGLLQSGDKDGAKKWRRKDVSVGQCVVIESSTEISQSEDNNLVKLIYLPYGMRDVITESIMNGTIEDATAFDLVIKKTKNSGGYADYGKSYFKTKSTNVPDSFLESLDDGSSYLYDLSKELPEVSTAPQVDEWLKNSIDIINGKVDGAGMTEGAVGVSSEVLNEEKQPENDSGSASDLLNRLNNRN